MALVFFPVYFLANYTYNAGVNLTTVASSTILSSSSSFFTVLLSWFTKVRPQHCDLKALLICLRLILYLYSKYWEWLPRNKFSLLHSFTLEVCVG